tara:strand:+ start:497 stop:1033 length:537 start_codon:yes stop_codon:yes gene_type:complete
MKKGTGKAPTTTITTSPVRTGGGGFNANMLVPFLYLFATPIMMGVGYLVVINPLLKKLGIKDDRQEKEAKLLVEQVKGSPIWTPMFYQQEGGNTMGISEARVYAERLYDAMLGGWTGWGTDENAISGVFNTLGSTGNVSIVSEAFQDMYGDSLISTLDSELSAEDFITYVASPISKYN